VTAFQRVYPFSMAESQRIRQFQESVRPLHVQLQRKFKVEDVQGGAGRIMIVINHQTSLTHSVSAHAFQLFFQSLASLLCS
jgi:hypothetical protein